MQTLHKNIPLLFCVSVLIILLPGKSNGQFAYYDSLSYSQYKNENWSGLLKTTKHALNDNLDYYYLRMRRGIAFYQKQNYLLAEKNFYKALKFNAGDPISGEYIYYSKLFSGKEKEALLYYYKNESGLKEKISVTKKPVTDFNADFVFLSNLEKDYSSYFESDEIQNFDGSQILTLNMSLASFLLSHDISKNFRLFHGGTFLNKTSFLYLNNAGISYRETIKNIIQYQYYGGLGFYPGYDFSFFTSLHYIHLSFPVVTLKGNGMGSSITLPSRSPDFYSARFSVYKQISLVKLGYGLSLSNLNNKEQTQWDGHFIFYPLGNRNLYLVSSLYKVIETSDTDTKSYLSYQNSIGLKTFEKLWLELNVKTGDSRNLSAREGYTIYNSDDIESLGINLSAIIPGLKRTYSLICSYSEFYNYYKDAFIKETNLNKTYSKNLSIIGELKWNF